MATTPEIKTRFTIDGMRQAATGLRAFGRTVSEILTSAGKNDPLKATAKGLSAAGIAAKGFEKELKNSHAQADSLAKSITKLGSAGTWRGIKLGAVGAGAAFVGLKAKVSAVSAAAMKAAKDSAASLKSVSIDAQRIGGSTSDVTVLGYAADLTGTDRDELITQIATISNEFLTLRENIDKSTASYTDFLTATKEDIADAKRLKDAEKLQEIQENFRKAELEARKGSVNDIDARIQQIQSVLNNGIWASDYYKALRPGSLPQEFGRATNTDSKPAISMLQRELRELQKARTEFWSTQSPQAQALKELERYGVNIAQASKGGVEGLLEISDAFRKIENPSQRARVAMRLFGEDAGVKLIPLLNGGREAIEQYRRVLEASGAIASPEDIRNAEEYSRAVLNLKTAFSGVEMTIGRALVPDLTKASAELTVWLIKSREQIAKAAVQAFNDTRVLAQDAASLFGGRTDNIQTGWLDVTVHKAIALRDVFADVRRQIDLLSDGKETDYKWINILRNGLLSVRAFAADVVSQVTLLWNGKDSDYAWVNTLRDAFLQVKAFALDAWAVVSGGNATNFDWLNKARDQVVAFGKRFQEAFEMLKGVVKSLGEFLKPVLDYLDTDIATFGLFLGLTRMVGLFSVLTAGVGLLFKALGSVFSLAGAAAGAVGAAGAAAGGAAGAAGTAAATAGGLRVALAGVGAAIGGLTSAALLLGTTLAGAFMLGQQAAKLFMAETMAAHEKVIDGQAAVSRAADELYMRNFLSRRDETSRDRRDAYWNNQGIAQGGWQGKTVAERNLENAQNSDTRVWGKARYSGDDAAAQYKEDKEYERAEQARRAAQPYSKRVAVDINVAGRTTTLEGNEVDAMQIARDLQRATRGY